MCWGGVVRGHFDCAGARGEPASARPDPSRNIGPIRAVVGADHRAGKADAAVVGQPFEDSGRPRPSSMTWSSGAGHEHGPLGAVAWRGYGGRRIRGTVGGRRVGTPPPCGDDSGDGGMGGKCGGRPPPPLLRGPSGGGAGSSSASLTRTREVTGAFAVDDAVIVAERQIHHRRATIWPFTTMGRSWILCMPRMPDCGGVQDRRGTSASRRRRRSKMVKAAASA